MKDLFKLLGLLLIALIANACKMDKSPSSAGAMTDEPVKQWNPEDTRSITAVYAKRGLIRKSDRATAGYVLFQPSASTSTYLINRDGEVVHEWKGILNSMLSYLLEDGHLLRLERDPDFPVFAAGGQAGRIVKYNWDGEVVWDFKYATDQYLTHHDIAPMSNGNVLAISYEVKSRDEAIAAGRDPSRVSSAGLWPDKIIEIKPQGPNGGEIVWEWHLWDHLVQDFDPSKSNYGNLQDHPRKFNINIAGEGGPPVTQEQVDGLIKAGFLTSNATVENMSCDFSHTNAIDYNEELDQIVFSSPGYNEVFIIDHSTTSEEARGAVGGRWGHGGDLLYRWGNPKNYGRGSHEDQKLFGQHDIRWIPKGYPGAGHLMVFNNDIPNPDNKVPSIWMLLMQSQSLDPPVRIGDIGNYSAVIEFQPPVDHDGSYVLPENGTFGPEEPVWTYMAPDKYSFYSHFISSAERLENGNTFINSGAQGRFLEVDHDGKIVWEYYNPYSHGYTLPDGTASQPGGPFLFGQFRTRFLTPDYPGLSGKKLQVLIPQPEATKPPSPPPSAG